MPIGGPHGLRIVGVAGKISQAVQLVAGIAPRFAALVAVVLIHGVEGIRQSVLGKCQRIGCEVFHGGVVVRAGVIAHQAGRVGVVFPFGAGFHEQSAVDPVQIFPYLVKMFVRITAGPES